MNPQFNYKLLLILNQKATLSRRSTPALGFTLTELLVTIVIAALILSSLLWLVVNLLNTDQREYALTETQRDMQRTLDYIVSDMKEAVYIYDGSCNLLPNATPTSNSCPSYANFLPSSGTPVLAFWKTDPVSSAALAANPFLLTPSSDACVTNFTGAKITECQGLRKKRYTYTLVVYSQDTTTGTNTWEGKSRIYRYELPKYATLTTLTRNQGYVDPSEAGAGVFQTWPYVGSTSNSTNLQATCSTSCLDGVAQVSGVASNTSSRVALTDFVDVLLPTDRVTALDADGDGSVESTEACRSGYQLTPRVPATGNASSLSFYACVRSNNEDRNNNGTLQTTAGLAEDFNGNNSLDTTNNVSANQDVIIYLRGNAWGRAGNVNDTTFTPILSTQVTMRGVIDKAP
jgi:prepilin-type N-terminal cleavage/methylation domain-containing protein